jgi:hypothetical protein
MSGAGTPMSGAGTPMSGAGMPMSGAGRPMSGAGRPMSGAGTILNDDRSPLALHRRGGRARRRHSNRVQSPFYQEVPMDRESQYKVEALRRVRDFLDTHAGEIGAAANGDARRELDTALRALAEVAGVREEIRREGRGESRRRRAMEEQLRRQYAAPLAQFARASLSDVPEYAALTPSLARLTGHRFADATRGMVAAAEVHRAALEAAHFPPQFLDEMREMAARIVESKDRRAAAGVRASGSSATLKDALRGGRDAVERIGAVLLHQFPASPGLLREWESAKRVHRTNTGRPAANASVTPVPQPAQVPEVRAAA